MAEKGRREGAERGEGNELGTAACNCFEERSLERINSQYMNYTSPFHTPHPLRQARTRTRCTLSAFATLHTPACTFSLAIKKNFSFLLAFFPVLS